MFKILLLFLLGLCALGADGHIQMSSPLPPRSPLGNGPGKKDYDYIIPLRTDGSDFPCKGYHKDPFSSVATYKAGEHYEMTLAGESTHGGGSCQLSLSYDNGKTFKVIKSVIGGCPLTKSYQFTIPKDAPSGQALFAWTWFNRIGNRELYMNCAQVTIEGGSSDASAINSLPDIFVANIDPVGCYTKEGVDLVFPNPGKNVQYGGNAAAGDKPGFMCMDSSDSPVYLPSAVQGQTTSKQGQQAPEQVTPLTPTLLPTPADPTTLTTPKAPMASTPSDTPTTLVVSTFRVSSQPSSLSSLSSSSTEQPAFNSFSPFMPPVVQPVEHTSQSISPLFMYPVSSTTQVYSPLFMYPVTTATQVKATSTVPEAGGQQTNSAVSGESSSGGFVGSKPVDNANCKPGAIRCDSETTFSLCIGSGYISMGSVAAGTVCRNGIIGYH